MYIQLLNLLASVITKKVTRSASPQFTTAPSNEKHESAGHGEISLRESHAPVYSVLRPVITSLHFTALGFFSFLYLKKIKFQKYMAVSKNFKTIPLCDRGLSPQAGRQDLNIKKNYI